MAWAAAEGIVKGTGGGLFEPEEECLRCEMTELFYAVRERARFAGIFKV